MSWKHSKVQGSDTSHGTGSDRTYSCASDPWSIYLFITEKTSQGIKLLLQVSEAASDVSSWPSLFPANQAKSEDGVQLWWQLAEVHVDDSRAENGCTQLEQSTKKGTKLHM